MSNAIFPTLPGLSWNIIKTPQWSTRKQQSVSGKEIRMSNRSRPIWKFAMSYEVLRGGSAYAELQQLMGFFNQRQGSFDSFLLQDGSDNSVSGQSFGTGDGSTTAFALLHQINGWLEPIGYSSSPSVFSAGVQQYSYARTNSIRNNTMVGAVAGSPGTTPTNWAISLSGGLSSSIVGTGVESGINYVDIRINGTPSGGSSGIRFENNTTIAAASGQTWSGSVYLRMAAGSIAGLNTVAPNVTGHNSSGTNTTDSSSVSTSLSSLSASNISQNRPAITYTLADAATVYTRLQLLITHAAGTAMDVTLRIGMPQMEQGSAPTLPIATSGSAVTKAADYSTDGASVTFAAAPTNGSALTWSGSFYYRVRFDKDLLDFDQFMKDLWQLKKCDLVGVI